MRRPSRWSLPVALLALVAALASLPRSSMGWFDEGHMTVAQIAYLQLEPAVAAVANLLVGELSPQFPATNDFMSAAVWPDDLKTVNITYFNDWHYITIPFNPNPNYTAVPPPQNENVVWSINMAGTALNGSATIPYGQQFMIRWVLHAVGDIHQPLHTISMYTSQFPVPNGDLGGNFFRVYWNNTKTNLHALLDSIVFTFLYEPIPRPLTPLGHQRLLYFAQQAMTANPRSSFTDDELNELDPQVWAQESHDLAVQYVYLNGTLQMNATIPMDYALNVLRPLLIRRIALGGYRLGNFLNNFIPSSIPAYTPWPPGKCPERYSGGALVATAFGFATIGAIVALIAGYFFMGWQAKRHKYQRAFESAGNESTPLSGGSQR
eukprot:c6286_g1_i1.p1 GENE.c6286_g1_i1~~c6286_g1_i1.p1  ORF type:complete len:378 (-),score=48.68 c6286_g1_i1:152-1285(-)